MCGYLIFDYFTIFPHKIFVSFPSRPFPKFITKNTVQIIQKYAIFALSTNSLSQFREICTKSPSVDMITAASRKAVPMEKVVALLLRWSSYTSTMTYCYPSLGIYYAHLHKWMSRRYCWTCDIKDRNIFPQNNVLIAGNRLPFVQKLFRNIKGILGQNVISSRGNK